MTSKRMRTIVKLEDGLAQGAQEEEQDKDALLQHLPSWGRPVEETGVAVSDMRLLRAHAEAQAFGIQGMEKAEQLQSLLQANAHIAQLKAALQASAATLQSKDDIIQANTALLNAKDAEISRLLEELRQNTAAVADSRAAALPAPAHVAAAAADAAGPCFPGSKYIQQVEDNSQPPSALFPLSGFYPNPTPLQYRIMTPPLSAPSPSPSPSLTCLRCS